MLNKQLYGQDELLGGCVSAQLENDDNDVQTIQELGQFMLGKLENDDSCVYSAGTLNQKLLEYYGEHIFISESTGHHDIICLCNMASFVITHNEDRKSDIGEESTRIVKHAAKLISIRLVQSQEIVSILAIGCCHC